MSSWRSPRWGAVQRLCSAGEETLLSLVPPEGSAEAGGRKRYLLVVARGSRSGRYRCVYVNVEPAQAAREDVGAGMRTILSGIGREAWNTLEDRTARDIWLAIPDREGPHAALRELLSEWAELNPTPLVLLVDEIDALIGDTLVVGAASVAKTIMGAVEFELHGERADSGFRFQLRYGF